MTWWGEAIHYGTGGIVRDVFGVRIPYLDTYANTHAPGLPAIGGAIGQTAADTVNATLKPLLPYALLAGAVLLLRD